MGFNADYLEQAKGFAGMIADGDRGRYIQTFVQGEVSAEIAFGWGVQQGVENASVNTQPGSPDGALLPTASNNVIAGLVVHSNQYDRNTELGTTGVKAGALLSIMKRGRILIPVEGSVTKGNQLYLRYTANGAGKTPGQWRADDDTSKAVLVKGVIADESITGAGLIWARVDMSVL